MVKWVNLLNATEEAHDCSPWCHHHGVSIEEQCKLFLESSITKGDKIFFINQHPSETTLLELDDSNIIVIQTC